MLSSKIYRLASLGTRSYYGRHRVGERDIVGHGCNGTAYYKDDAHFPFPAVRFKDSTSEVQAIKVKEKGHWKELPLKDKKALYRASFCQTFVEFKHPTGQWKFCLGWALGLAGCAFWIQMFYHYFVAEELPPSLTEESRKAQFRRMLDLHVNAVDGLSTKWNYKTNNWKLSKIISTPNISQNNILRLFIYS